MEIDFSNRHIRNPQPVNIGVAGDNQVMDLVFTGLPEWDDAPIVTLHWSAGGVGDIEVLTQTERGWEYTVTSVMTRLGDGGISAYVQMTSGERVWHSAAFALSAYQIPGAGEAIPPLEPSIIDQIIRTALDVQIAKEAAESASSIAQTKVDSIMGMSAVVTEIEPGESATANVDVVDGAIRLTLGLPKGGQSAQGEKGDPGEKGEKGDPGEPGDPGAQGIPGEPGAAGHTPVRGIDYWTTADQTEIIAQIEGIVSGAVADIVGGAY